VNFTGTVKLNDVHRPLVVTMDISNLLKGWQGLIISLGNLQPCGQLQMLAINGDNLCEYVVFERIDLHDAKGK